MFQHFNYTVYLTNMKIMNFIENNDKQIMNSQNNIWSKQIKSLIVQLFVNNTIWLNSNIQTWSHVFGTELALAPVWWCLNNWINFWNWQMLHFTKNMPKWIVTGNLFYNFHHLNDGKAWAQKWPNSIFLVLKCHQFTHLNTYTHTRTLRNWFLFETIDDWDTFVLCLQQIARNVF